MLVSQIIPARRGEFDTKHAIDIYVNRWYRIPVTCEPEHAPRKLGRFLGPAR